MIIHRFWMGRPMPQAYREYGQRWRDLNPSASICDWGEDIVSHFPAMIPVFTDLYERDAARGGVEMAVQIADIMGYALVERFGGVYVNCDMEPVRPLEGLPDAAWASYENTVDGRITNAAIGAPYAHHPFWGDLLRALPENYFAHRYDEMVMATGPGFLTNFAATASHRAQFAVLPMTVFNSVHWKTIRPGENAANLVAEGRYPEDAIAVHHWGHKKDGRSNTVETATHPTWT